MRLYAPLYEGDSILRPDAAFGEPAARVFRSPAPAPNFVRSNIQVEAANETALDIHAIEQIARRQRSAEIARLLKALFTAVGAWFEREQSSESDSYFAASHNLADRQRSAEIPRLLKVMFAAAGEWFERNEYSERDRFFAASDNLAELEQRQRHFERTGMAHY